jgi:hypothetical protein
MPLFAAKAYIAYLMEKKIRSITVTQYDYIIRDVNDEELDIQGHPHHYSEYGTAGNIVKEIRYSRQGEFEEMLEYEYDDRGNLTRESYFPEENELAEEKVFEYDETGNPVRAFKKYQDGSVDTTTFEYNDDRRLVKKTTVNDEGEVEQVEQFTWDKDNLVSYEAVDAEGNDITGPVETTPDPDRSRITRNEKGQVVTEEELDETGQVIMTVKRTYDADDQADEVEVFLDGRGKTISRHYYLKYSYTFFE